MRTDQYIGLSPTAFNWLHEHGSQETVTTIERVVNHRTGIVNETENAFNRVETLEGQSLFPFRSMFDHDEPTGKLNAYVLKDGRIVHERVQREPWASGSTFFTALAWPDGTIIKETAWSNEEIRGVHL